jgi:DNA-binding HxlR family transcriptional regulator
MKQRTPTICPIVYSLDIFGDKWSLVVLRDILIHNKRHFGEFLSSAEKIASNILSNRLELLLEHGFLSQEPDPANKSAIVYVPTQKALELLPMMIEMMRWGMAHNPETPAGNEIMNLAQDNPEALRARIAARFS